MLVCCREQLDASYDRLKALREQETALLAELQQQQASNTEAELAGLQAVVDDLTRKKVGPPYYAWSRAAAAGRSLLAVLPDSLLRTGLFCNILIV